MLAGAVVIALGCYNPHVQSGGLQCAQTSPACPDGFSCVGGFCVSDSAAAGGQGGAGAGGAGGAGTCAVPVEPLCTPAQPPIICDPVCQTGCPCGQRCEVSATGLKCVPPAGNLALGTVCTPEGDACAPGLTCLKEMCGVDLGRCYRFCTVNSDGKSTCESQGVCGTPVLLPDKSDSGQRVCNLGNYPCDPYTQTGCVDSALNCYVTTPTFTACDCPSSAVPAPVGAPCSIYNDCAVGLACLEIGGSSLCVTLCQTAADCGGAACQPFGAFGYCAPAS